MKTKSFFTNKYIIGILLVLIIISVDILLHPGMSRVMLPKTFTSDLPAQFPTFCDQPLKISGKRWVKAVNHIEKLNALDSSTSGFEMDIYFDEDLQKFFVYHDSSELSQITLQDILNAYQKKELKASVWLDFKNLSHNNQHSALTLLEKFRDKYHLQHKMIIESSQIKCLNIFCEAGFFTSYYISFFNPYQMDEAEIRKTMLEVSGLLKQNPVSAISGYYFQIPLLSYYFPQAQLLTWAEADWFSLISPVFNSGLLAQEQVKIVLYD